jgi:hypothetical protein
MILSPVNSLYVHCVVIDLLHLSGWRTGKGAFVVVLSMPFFVVVAEHHHQKLGFVMCVYFVIKT